MFVNLLQNYKEFLKYANNTRKIPRVAGFFVYECCGVTWSRDHVITKG